MPDSATGPAENYPWQPRRRSGSPGIRRKTRIAAYSKSRAHSAQGKQISVKSPEYWQ